MCLASSGDGEIWLKSGMYEELFRETEKIVLNEPGEAKLTDGQIGTLWKLLNVKRGLKHWFSTCGLQSLWYSKTLSQG